MKFSEYNISREIKERLEELGFKRPTDIQYKAIPSILKSEDVLAIAQTGTGKTAAFAIPVIHLLNLRKKFNDVPGIKCVVMVPTHELAIQLSEVFSEIGKYTEVKTLGIYGGVDQAPQIKKLKEGVDIIIATPGRLFDLLSQKHIKLRSLEILILDEADHMLDMGFYNDIKELTTYIPQERQTLFFSATINEKIKDLAYSLVKNAIRIQISPKDPVSKNVDHAVMFVAMDDKRFFLERLINEHPDTKVLVFVRTKVRAERVMTAMARVGIQSITMHGGKDQQDRLLIMEKFKSGEIKLLIATDVSARGIDIAGVNYVINYDLPDEAENYVHRVGRTGRGTQKGHAVSFCSEEEKPILKEIENYLTKPIRVIEVKKEDYTQTLLHTEDTTDNWKLLMKEAAQMDKTKPKKANKKR
jgi:ATP-dependent RNA helicase RhlE